MQMIAIGSDYGGYNLKEELKRYLEEKNIECKDFGSNEGEIVDYPCIAKEVCKAIQKKECDRGILICRSGTGMDIVANKYKGIRASNCDTEEKARMSRLHNDTNVLTLGADYISVNDAICILRAWISTEFEGGRHAERVRLIGEIEAENMK